ncbi:MAG: DNA repair protein [Clostridiales bacterium]|nr:DNA repair protein [Clostridiales bacterium]MDY4769693.1 DNA repair protein [Lachnospiraceae bacterium]
MTDKELRRLSRSELLEMLLSLTEENEKLKIRLEQAEDQLRDRRILIDKAGSIAEAALQLNNIFEDADRAVQQYLENVRRMTEEDGAL